MDYAAACVIGYLLGSVPFAALAARRHGVDLYRTGDGNPGAWNALEQLGAGRAWPAFLGDGLKGSLAAAAGLLLGGVWPAYVAVGAAMVGHALPLFARFRGGKAVMTFIGGGLVLAPLPALACLVLCLLVTLATRSFAWGARAAVLAFPLAQVALEPVERVAATGALMCMIGALFALRRGSAARASSGTAAAPTR